MCIYIETTETWSCGLCWPIKMLSNDFIYWVQRVATFFVNRAKMFKHQDRSSITAYYLLLIYTHRADEDSWGRPEDCAIHPGLPPMRQQPRINASPAGFFPSPWFFSTFLSAGLVSSCLQVPALVQSSRYCQDLSSKRILSICIFSLVWGLIPAYSLLNSSHFWSIIFRNLKSSNF